MAGSNAAPLPVELLRRRALVCGESRPFLKYLNRVNETRRETPAGRLSASPPRQGRPGPRPGRRAAGPEWSRPAHRGRGSPTYKIPQTKNPGGEVLTRQDRQGQRLGSPLERVFGEPRAACRRVCSDSQGATSCSLRDTAEAVPPSERGRVPRTCVYCRQLFG